MDHPLPSFFESASLLYFRFFSVFSFFFRHFRTVAGLSSFVAQMASFPLDLSNMEMTELPEYVFENDTEKEKVPIAKKYNLSLDSDDEDDDCGNCSL